MNKLLSNKNLIQISIFIFLLLSSLWLLNNKLQYEITNSAEDDVHTMNIGINSMYSGKVDTLRVGESTRWLARVIYPVALYYMNSNMGGEHFVTTWNYPSGFYIQKYFKDPNVKNDPNLQDFVFAMKFCLGSLVILSFIGASYMLSRRYNMITGISYFTLSISTTMMMNMLSVFYTESTLVIIFNIIVIIALLEAINKWRLYIWLAFLSAFAISTKLTGLIFILPIIAIIISKDKDLFKNMKIEGFLILIVIFYLLINIFSTSYMSLLDQYMANVYHVKTGHLETVPSGFYQFKLIVKALSPWIFIFPLSLVFILFHKKIENKLFIIFVALASILIFGSQIDVSMTLIRNLTISLIMMIFVISISLGLFVIYLFDKNDKLQKKETLIIFTLFAIFLIFYIYYLNKHTFKISPTLITKSLKECKSVATIDIEDRFVDNSTKLPSMPDTFTLENQLEQFRNQFLPYDCIAIKRVKNNKHYTNYILPLDYKLETRFGKYFVYKNLKRYQDYTDSKAKLEVTQ